MKLNRDFRKTSSDSSGLQWSTWLSLRVLSFSPLTNKYSKEKLKTKDLPDYGNKTLKPHRITWILSCIFWMSNRKHWSVFCIIKGNESEDKCLLKFWVTTESVVTEVWDPALSQLEYEQEPSGGTRGLGQQRRPRWGCEALQDCLNCDLYPTVLTDTFRNVLCLLQPLLTAAQAQHRAHLEYPYSVKQNLPETRKWSHKLIGMNS